MRAATGNDSENLFLIHEAVAGVGIRMNNSEAENTVWSLYRNCTENFRSAGLETIPKTGPKIGVK